MTPTRQDFVRAEIQAEEHARKCWEGFYDAVCDKPITPEERLEAEESKAETLRTNLLRDIVANMPKTSGSFPASGQK
jgi:hypothetical protein